MIRNTKNQLLTPEQVAERLQVSTYTVRKMIRTRQIDSIHLTDRSIRVSEGALINFIETKTIKKKNHAKRTDKNKKQPQKGLPSFRALRAV
jgi:excisionase family DNA binding protein